MLKIWGRTNSINVQKVLWCCAELNLEYDRIDAGGKFGVNLQPLFWNLVRVEPGKRDMKAVEDSRKKLADNFKIVEAAVAKRPYMAGAAFTMGDIPMGVALHRWFLLPVERPNYPNLAAYYERLKQRPGFAEHCAAPLT